MSNILGRFKDIMSANVNALLDKLEDPEKAIDQYLRNMASDLEQVKVETANVMAEESRTKRSLDENINDVDRYTDLAKKALLAQNEADATVFIEKKQQLEVIGAGLQNAYSTAHTNATKMREMHNKLVSDINELKAKRDMLKAKISVAKTQENVNSFSSINANRGGKAAFDSMEEKVNRRLDAANALEQLNKEPLDSAAALAEKYQKGNSSQSVQDELARLKASLEK